MLERERRLSAGCWSVDDPDPKLDRQCFIVRDPGAHFGGSEPLMLAVALQRSLLEPVDQFYQLVGLD
jgi:hypothetical protein